MDISSSNNFVTLFSSIKKKLYKIINNEIKEYDISITEAIYLIIVSEHQSGITFKELTKVADCDKGMTTKVINSLKDKNLIESLGDDRYFYKVTNTGKDISKSIKEIFDNLKQRLLKRIDKSELIRFYDMLYNFNGILEGEI